MPRLSQVLRERGLSNSEVKRALDSGKVFFDGIPTSDGGRDVGPERVTVRPAAPRITPGRDLYIVHRDSEVVVAWKPPGLLAVPARSRADGHISVLSVVGNILGQKMWPVHRIDAPTSGLMMVARNETAQLHLKAQLEAHTVERRYLAFVAGHIKERLTIDLPLVRNRGDGRRGAVPLGQGVPHDALKAVTHIERLALVGRRTSLVAATLESGRTHQVRLHLEAIRHPLLGDTLYAPASISGRSPRLALHAAALGFDHPNTGERLRFDTPLPDDLEQLRRSANRPPPERGPRHDRRRKSKQRRKR